MRFRLSRINLLLGIISLVTVLYAEWIYPAKAFDQCEWPPLGPTAKHVALIADPQLVDDHTYPGRNGLFMWFTRVITDRYMARNFRMLHRKLRPDAIFFLGDLFDGGRQWEDPVWEAEFRRWQQIFPASKSVAHYKNLPGNHDVGSANDIIPAAFDRFKKRFGNPNQVQTIGEHSIVTLDTNALMNEQPSINGAARDFLERLKADQEAYDPMIVLTHVPLFRTDGSYCGFEREGRPLTWEVGHQYITEVGPPLTQDIIYGLKPAYVFSGDDHDACKYTHRYGLFQSVEENTVKSFSMAMGITRPGFQLLSLDTRKRHGTESCLVGKPFFPIILQASVYSVLTIVLLAYTWLSAQKSRTYNQLPISEMKRPRDKRETIQDILSKPVSQGILTMAGAWFLGQFFINAWSYGKLPI